MKNVTAILLIAFLSGCTQPPASQMENDRVAVDSLNQQIENFNANKKAGTYPIDQRVTQIVFGSKKDRATCLNADGEPFLVLTRQEDGTFRGILEVEYHLLAGAGSGHILAEFRLAKDMF